MYKISAYAENGSERFMWGLLSQWFIIEKYGSVGVIIYFNRITIYNAPCVKPAITSFEYEWSLERIGYEEMLIFEMIKLCRQLSWVSWIVVRFSAIYGDFWNVQYLKICAKWL